MKKVFLTCMFIYVIQLSFGQNVEGSWLLVADNGMGELSINESDKVIGIEAYDKVQRPTGKRDDLEIVAIVQKEGYKLYVGQIPNQEKYITLCFFEDKGDMKLFFKEKSKTLDEAKSVEKVSNLGIYLYRKDKMKEIQSLKSIQNIDKTTIKKVLKTSLQVSKKEIRKHKKISRDMEYYVIGQIYRELVKKGYSPYSVGSSVEDIIEKFEEDEEVKAILKKIEKLIEPNADEMKVEEKKED